MIITLIKNLLINIVKVIASIIGFLLMVAFLSFVLSYLTIWTSNKDINSLPSGCYIAVNEDKQFIRYTDFIKQPQSYSVSLQDSLSKQESIDDVWQLTTDNDVKEVYFRYDLGSWWFRYRIVNNVVEPVSCRTNNIATTMLAFFVLIAMMVLYMILSPIYQRVIVTTQHLCKNKSFY